MSLTFVLFAEPGQLHRSPCAYRFPRCVENLRDEDIGIERTQIALGHDLTAQHRGKITQRIALILGKR